MASLKIVKLKADAPDRLAPFSQNRPDRMPGREFFAAERKHPMQRRRDLALFRGQIGVP